MPAIPGSVKVASKIVSIATKKIDLKLELYLQLNQTFYIYRT